MATFTMLDASQARARKDWWLNQSKKIPQGPGISSLFESMLKDLGNYNKDPSPESALMASGSLTNLDLHVQKMPLVKVFPKKYQYFFTGLQNTKNELEKFVGKATSMREIKRDIKGTAAGKGVDSKKAGDEHLVD